MEQEIVKGIEKLEGKLKEYGADRIMLVCEDYLKPEKYLSREYVRFGEFSSNPLYEDVKKGVELYRKENCDAIVAIGGGSSIDTAKCIKLYCKMDPEKNYLTQEYADTGVPLIAIPTTAGTGSESTRYAVIYYEGKKQSVTHDSILPSCAILEPEFLKTLPMYQKKSTMLDALCQGIESWWSVNSTEESKQYSRLAVETIVKYMDAYLENPSDEDLEQIMLAANLAGRAINITQTTAAHAMSYKITHMYNFAHGHAVAICLPEVWSYIEANGDRKTQKTLKELERHITREKFLEILDKLQIEYPTSSDRKNDLEQLSGSVNPERLKNTPAIPNRAEIYCMYERIVKGK